MQSRLQFSPGKQPIGGNRKIVPRINSALSSIPYKSSIVAGYLAAENEVLFAENMGNPWLFA
jgi:hypothetical protein